MAEEAARDAAHDIEAVISQCSPPRRSPTVEITSLSQISGRAPSVQVFQAPAGNAEGLGSRPSSAGSGAADGRPRDRSPQCTKTICIPCTQRQNERILDDPLLFREFLGRQIEATSELFPPEIGKGYRMKDIDTSRKICELCEDAGTCLIAINDSIDTADENWWINGFVASFKHESSNKDTTRRIRRSIRNRFEEGGVIQSSMVDTSPASIQNSDSEVAGHLLPVGRRCALDPLACGCRLFAYVVTRIVA
jgi:hypothetical protein